MPLPAPEVSEPVLAVGEDPAAVLVVNTVNSDVAVGLEPAATVPAEPEPDPEPVPAPVLPEPAPTPVYCPLFAEAVAELPDAPSPKVPLPEEPTEPEPEDPEDPEAPAEPDPLPQPVPVGGWGGLALGSVGATCVPGLGNWTSNGSTVLHWFLLAILKMAISGRLLNVESLPDEPVTDTVAQFMYISRLPIWLNHVHAKVYLPLGTSEGSATDTGAKGHPPTTE